MFIPHILHDKLTISTVRQSSSESPRFVVRAVLEDGAVTDVFGAALSDTETRKIMSLAASFERYETMLADVQRSRLSETAALIHADPALNAIAMLQGKYLKSAIVFETVLADYEQKTPLERFSPELSIDIYRLCAERLELDRGITIITADLALGKAAYLSRHHKECIFDAAYELRFKKRDYVTALGFLHSGFMVNKTPERARGLIQLGRKVGKPKSITAAGAFLMKHGDLTPRQWAIVGVAYADLGQFEGADASLDGLKTHSDPAAKPLADKLALYISERLNDHPT